jgi:hypothetical protein
MKPWARVVFVAAFLVLATLPFDSLLNRRYFVYPLCIVCAILGLVAMYLLTLPDKPSKPRSGGGPS